jgi:hypothetical protein
MNNQPSKIRAMGIPNETNRLYKINAITQVFETNLV